MFCNGFDDVLYIRQGALSQISTGQKARFRLDEMITQARKLFDIFLNNPGV